MAFGKSAAYRLLSLLEAKEQAVQLARFAYVLARLDPGEHAASAGAYQQIRTQLYAWYRDKKERRQLSTALQFIIYSIREKGARDGD